jgi:hypothetical protein
MVALVKTTAWGGLHGSLALVLNDKDYAVVTTIIVTLLALLTKPTTINPKINKLSNPYDIPTLQEEMKTLQEEFELQEAVTTSSEYSTTLTALKNSTMKNSAKNSLAMPIQPSKHYYHTSARTGARS